MSDEPGREFPKHYDKVAFKNAVFELTYPEGYECELKYKGEEYEITEFIRNRESIYFELVGKPVEFLDIDACDLPQDWEFCVGPGFSQVNGVDKNVSVRKDRDFIFFRFDVLAQHDKLGIPASSLKLLKQKLVNKTLDKHWVRHVLHPDYWNKISSENPFEDELGGPDYYFDIFIWACPKTNHNLAKTYLRLRGELVKIYEDVLHELKTKA